MSTDYTSETLVHFVGWRAPTDDDQNYRTLSSILREGILAKLPHDGSWGAEEFRIDPTRSLLDERLIVPRMVCVADIPEHGLPVHCAKYGLFGVGFARAFLVRYGFRPVMYFPYSKDDHLGAYGRTRLQWIQQAFRDCYESDQNLGAALPRTRTAGSPSKTTEEVMKAASTAFLRDLLPFLKPFDADLHNEDPKNYYLEREWRRLGNLRFRPDDVVKVYVAEGFVARAKAEHPEFASRVCQCPTA
jgi:hypothetical protein